MLHSHGHKTDGEHKGRASQRLSLPPHLKGLQSPSAHSWMSTENSTWRMDADKG